MLEDGGLEWWGLECWSVGGLEWCGKAMPLAEDGGLECCGKAMPLAEDWNNGMK